MKTEKENMIKFIGPKGEVKLSEEEIILLFNVASLYLDCYIDCEWDCINDSNLSAMTHKDPDIMEQHGDSWHRLSDATKVQKLIDERFWKKTYHNNEHRFETQDLPKIKGELN